MKYIVTVFLLFLFIPVKSQWIQQYNYPGILTDIAFDSNAMYTFFQNGLIRIDGDTLAIIPTYNFNECGLLSGTLYMGNLVYNTSSQGGQHIIMDGDTLLSVPYSGTIHRGGTLVADADTLYIAFGSGTVPSDAQDTTNLRGKIVKIYPPAYIPEIVCYGLRNPWQFFKEEDHLWIADVGSDYYEEVNISYFEYENFGWNCSEGDTIFNTDCGATVNPVFTYPNPGNASIIGGVVYNGWYYFCDWFSTDGWRIMGDVVEPFIYPEDINVFALDSEGNMYAGSWDAKIYMYDLPLSIDTVKDQEKVSKKTSIPFRKLQYIRYVDLWGRESNDPPNGWSYDRWMDRWVIINDSGTIIYGTHSKK